MKTFPWKNRDWLASEYKTKAAQTIGAENGVSGEAISYWLKKHQIKKRSKREIVAITKRVRPKNYAGGIAKHSLGYVLVFVGKKHHLAHKATGYALQHRIVAEEMIGRRLLPGEVVHHKNEIRNDNRPENLVVCKTRFHHKNLHRKSKSRSQFRTAGQSNRLIDCACGCGKKLHQFYLNGYRRKFIHGHNRRVSGVADARCKPSSQTRRQQLWQLLAAKEERE